MTQRPLPETNAELAQLWREQLGVRGNNTLTAKLRRAPGPLPRALRRDVRFLIDMEKLWEHPKLRRRIDNAEIDRAQQNLRSFLEAVNPRDRRIGRLIGILAPLMFNVLLVFAGVVIWLVFTDRV